MVPEMCIFNKHPRGFFSSAGLRNAALGVLANGNNHDCLRDYILNQILPGRSHFYSCINPKCLTHMAQSGSVFFQGGWDLMLGELGCLSVCFLSPFQVMTVERIL